MTLRTRPTKTRRAPHLCACGCGKPASLLHQIAPGEAYHADCALALVLFALRNPELLAGAA